MRIDQEDRVALAAIRSAVPELIAVYRFGEFTRVLLHDDDTPSGERRE